MKSVRASDQITCCLPALQPQHKELQAPTHVVGSWACGCSCCGEEAAPSEPSTATATSALQAMPRGPQAAVWFLLWSHGCYSPTFICPSLSAEDPHEGNPYYYLSSSGHPEEHPRNKGEERCKGVSLDTKPLLMLVSCGARVEAPTIPKVKVTSPRYLQHCRR